MKYLIYFVYCFGVFGDKVLGFVGLNYPGIEYVVYIFVLGLVGVKVFHGKIEIPSSYALLIGVVSILLLSCVYWGDKVTWVEYFVSVLMLLLIPTSFVVFYNWWATKKELCDIVKGLSVIMILPLSVNAMLIAYYGEMTTNAIFKTPALAASMSGIGFISCLVMFVAVKHKKYIIYAFVYYVLVIMHISVKTFVLISVVLVVWFIYYYKNRIVRIFILFFLGTILFFALPNSFKGELSDKFNSYFFSEKAATVPRNALYTTSYAIASEKFPFGSGVGTFGSFYVVKRYSDVYFEYGLDKVWGLGPESAGDYKKYGERSFLLDTYWSSIIGELGFIGFICYFLIFLYPVSVVYFIGFKRHDKGLLLFNVLVVLFVLIESIYLSSPFQVSFIVVFAGFTGAIYRYITDVSIRKTILRYWE